MGGQVRCGESTGLIENLRDWVEYIGAAALVWTGTSMLLDGSLVGVVLLVIGAALLFVAGGSGKKLRQRAASSDNLTDVPSIQDDDSLR